MCELVNMAESGIAPKSLFGASKLEVEPSAWSAFQTLKVSTRSAFFRQSCDHHAIKHKEATICMEGASAGGIRRRCQLEGASA